MAAFQGDSYNIGTALTYLMRAGKKIYVNNSAIDSRVADIKKAINHLNFELDRLRKIKIRKKNERNLERCKKDMKVTIK